jgi:hypothetical protein
LEEPETVKEASDLLGQYGESARVYAGGTELLLAMKEGLIRYERLINIKRIPGLNEILAPCPHTANLRVHLFSGNAYPLSSRWSITSPISGFGRLVPLEEISLLPNPTPTREPSS